MPTRPTFNSPEEEGIWQSGRDYERNRGIDAIQVEIMNPDYEKDSYEMFILGLRVAVQILKEISFDE